LRHDASRPPGSDDFAKLEDIMRAETETVVNEIKESLSLLRRHL
jgi:hypothetical protein